MANSVPDLTPDALERIEKDIAGSGMSRWLNISATAENDGLSYRLGFAEGHIGNPVIRALHGGVISSFLESCARLELIARLSPGVHLRTTSVHTSYFRSSKAQDMLARISLQRVGRRFAFVEATGWQGEEDNVVARSAIGIRVIRSGEE
ncbi:PaaI family thioesterase [Aquisalinus flavus]|uniref:Thioesterase domain-containing protein n=1 Tax=Aquisalinus flavus TaxID=1526572 RepID=A0A8J2V6H4_9PROT|nr:PaaI family thioesterase [Aquisalinus flavus]MBD0427906.1 PaaI family thioesterase [Aquisalinus flavus]UNE47665.1 PaaI family thioesterase [Aquisalinus flavus]GGD04803.1 hypothetical protein GCM10011342_12230 [Aquisalinus flavus]